MPRANHVAPPAVSSRLAALTGLRGVAAMLVVGTHAAFGTGKETHGFLGMVYTRLEIGVPIFFVLSGFLLFRPWVRAAAEGRPPEVHDYVRRRIRRIAPAYLVVVLAAFLVYQFRSAGPNPGHTVMGLVRYLTLTQIYGDNYLLTSLHQGLTQMWSLAVEVSFYAVLPLLAHLLLATLCGGQWRPGMLLAALAILGAFTPAWLLAAQDADWLPNSAGMWLPAHLVCFVCGMALAVLSAMGVRCYAFVAVPLAAVSFLIVCTPIAGEPMSTSVSVWAPLVKSVFFAWIATLVVAPLVLGAGGGYSRILSSAPLVWLGEISYEIFLVHVIVMDFALVSVLHWPLFTGSTVGLFAVTLLISVPIAWLLHRVTVPRTPSHPLAAKSTDGGQRAG